MKLLIFLSGIAIFLIIVFYFMRRDNKGQTGIEVWPFHARNPLSQNEAILYWRLTEALPEYVIFSQVHLPSILAVKKGNNFHSWNNRINKMSVNFMICRKKDLGIVVVIDLDDSNRKKEERGTTDEQKEKALADAGITMLRWNVKELPDTATIKEAVKIKPKPNF